jgi:hypothetical protein
MLALQLAFSPELSRLRNFGKHQKRAVGRNDDFAAAGIGPQDCKDQL